METKTPDSYPLLSFPLKQPVFYNAGSPWLIKYIISGIKKKSKVFLRLFSINFNVKKHIGILKFIHGINNKSLWILTLGHLDFFFQNSIRVSFRGPRQEAWVSRNISSTFNSSKRPLPSK